MSSDPSWRPNETPTQIWIEQATLDGVIIEAVGYGAHLTLFFQCVELLWEVRRRQPKFAYSGLAYIFLLSICCSIGAGCSFRVNQQAFVDYRNFPGGPAQYTLLGFNRLNVLGPAAYMACSWLQDGLLLYRFFIIYGEAFWPMVVPTLIYISSIVFSCLLISQISLPGATLWAPGNLSIVLGFGSTTCATTLLLSGLIVARLIYTRYQVKKAMGTDELAPYLTVSAMIVESAALYVVTALTFMITYAADSTVSYLIYGFLGQAPSIAPLLIIKRVAQGRAASRRAPVTPSVFTTEIQFGAPDMSTTSPSMFDSEGTTTRELTSKGPKVDVVTLGGSDRVHHV